MRRLRHLIAGRKILLVLYVLATATLGLAHKPIAFAKTSNLAAVDLAGVDLAAYAMPDGSLPTICRTGNGTLPGKTHVGAACEACLLTAAPGLPVTNEDVRVLLFSAPCRIGPIAEAEPIAKRHVTAAQPRAPPLSLAV